MDRNDVNTVAKALITGHDEALSGKLAMPAELPERDEVLGIIELLRKILFPGYFDNGAVNAPDIGEYIAELLVELKRKLSNQVRLSLALDRGEADREGGDHGAVNICENFISKLPLLREILRTDIQATYDGDPAAKNEHEVIVAYPGIFAITVYRLAHELNLLSVPYIPRMMTEYVHSRTGVDIHPGAKIGHHFCIDHGTGIVIGETTEIGSYVKLYQGVTLGALSTRGGQSLRGKKRHPTIEDGVTVYAGATILGGETIIGKGSVIGGNSFVIQSVPPNTSVSIKKPELDIRLRDIERPNNGSQYK